VISLFSVLEPDGRLRTVTYVSDEQGFRPIVTYSQANVGPAVNAVPVAPVLKEPLPLYAAAPAPTLLKSLPGFHAYASPLQYAASYGTPVFTVKEARHFYKTAPPVVPLGFATHVQTQPIRAHVVKARPVLVRRVVKAQPILPLVVNAPPPAIPNQKIPEPSGYAYPVPEVKLEYPPPEPPRPSTTTPSPKIVEIETTSSPVGGYAYPVPEVKLEYPPPEPPRVPEKELDYPKEDKVNVDPTLDQLTLYLYLFIFH